MTEDSAQDQYVRLNNAKYEHISLVPHETL